MLRLTNITQRTPTTRTTTTTPITIRSVSVSEKDRAGGELGVAEALTVGVTDRVGVAETKELTTTGTPSS